MFRKGKPRWLDIDSGSDGGLISRLLRTASGVERVVHPDREWFQVAVSPGMPASGVVAAAYRAVSGTYEQLRAG